MSDIGKSLIGPKRIHRTASAVSAFGGKAAAVASDRLAALLLTRRSHAFRRGSASLRLPAGEYGKSTTPVRSWRRAGLKDRENPPAQIGRSHQKDNLDRDFRVKVRHGLPA
jgi:hypothetical protein